MELETTKETDHQRSLKPTNSEDDDNVSDEIQMQTDMAARFDHTALKSESYVHPLEAFDVPAFGTEVKPEQIPVKEQVISLNDSKAGMQGLDINKINKIIADASEGSKFYEHKKKVKERLEQKSKDMRKLYDQLSPLAVTESQRKVDRIARDLESSKDPTKVIVHIDMDCFFAAVEMRDNPTLKEKPMAVGSYSMLSTSNYIARKFGVRAAMPGFIAKKLCPKLIIIPPNFEKYSAASEIAAKVYRAYDPNCYSCMDEASLDITDYISSNLTERDDRDTKIETTVNEIRQKVCVATNGLTCSAGISPVGFLSKICSDMNKPNGQFYLKAPEVKDFLKNLKIRKVCGIGEATEGILRALDIEQVGDIWEKRGALNLLFKPSTADFLFRVALGIGRSFFAFPSHSSENSASSGASDDQKSISCERTFSETGDLTFISDLCQRIAEDLSQDLLSKNCTGKAVAVKIKLDTFEVRSRIRTLLDYTNDPEIIYKTAMSIFQSLRSEQEGMILRLFGLRISTLKFGNTNHNQDSTCSAGSIKQFLVFKEPAQAFDCPICQKRFVSSITLQKHVEDCLDAAETTERLTSFSSIVKQNSESSNSTNSIAIDKNCSKRQYSEDTKPGVPASSDDVTVTFSSNLPTKRLKITETTSEHQPNATTKGAAKSTKNSKNTVSSKKQKDSPIKMMPINFYFQTAPKQ